MKNILTSNLKGKLIALSVGLVVYVGLQVLSMTVLKNVYVFEWMGRSRYCYTWISALLLILFDKTLISYFVTFGTLFGTIIGQYLGDFLCEQKMALITPDMSAEQQYYLSLHHGVLIFAVTVLISVAVGIVLNIILRKPKNKPATAT